jgi:fused signal recognition particle receptor
MSTPQKPESDTATGGRLFGRLGERLVKTRQQLGRGLGDLLRGKSQLDDELLDEIESVLLSSDVGLDATQALLADVEGRARKAGGSGTAVLDLLRQSLLDLLRPRAQALVLPEERTEPFVIMVVGVNGVGKTTSCGKLAQRLKANGHRVMLAAADTFRAAAVEQLQQWGQRLDVPVIAQGTGADAAAVAHDAMEAARARGIDVLIVDTAGRQHTHSGLMDELKKVRRVIERIEPNAPHEVLLVLDAGTGQNALSQLKHFDEAVQVTGIALTKLDGTARGGVLVAIAHQGEYPIRFIGVGESAEDLREFDADEFVDALLPDAPIGRDAAST